MERLNLKHGGEVLKVAKSLKANPREILDFSSNTNPLGPPKGALKAIEKAIELMSFYPDEDYEEFREAIARNLNVRFDEVIEANGATEMIYNFVALAKEGSKAIIPLPTFSEYEKACKMKNLKIHYIPIKKLNSFMKEMKNSSMIFLCNPNNPDSHLFKREELYELLREAEEKDCYTLIDESFLPFSIEEDKYSLVKDSSKFSKLLVIRSLTKFFCLPGVRVGYAIANKELAEKIKGLKASWSLNCFAEKIAIECLKDTEYINRTKNLIHEEKDFLYNELKEFFYPYETKVNFLLVKLKNIKSYELKSRLIKKKILIRDCSNIRGLNQNYIRVSVRDREDNIKLIKALREVMNFG
ncbi:MAG: threonine-phosphate decarboxylase CobD [Nitrososphaerales archaeon]